MDLTNQTLSNGATIPVARPQLPSAGKLVKYFNKIDNSRQYSNFGPLVHDLEERLSLILGGQVDSVVTASSGTMALQLSISAKQFAVGSFIMMPSFTHIGTAAAVVMAGHKPMFTDVDENDWSLTPLAARKILGTCDIKPAAVVVVAPFGLFPNIYQWEEFVRDTGIAVFIDAASVDIDDITTSYHIPVMVSLHATKLLGAGEGGLICCRDQAYLKQIRSLSNFGNSPLGIEHVGTNAKMSEYHAAVGLASLDNLSKTKADLQIRCSRYNENLKHMSSIKLLPGFGETRVNVTSLISGPQELERILNDAGVETKKWWRSGCHLEPAFQNQEYLLPITKRLSVSYLGLPMFQDIDLNVIDYICELISTHEFKPKG